MHIFACGIPCTSRFTLSHGKPAVAKLAFLSWSSAMSHFFLFPNLISICYTYTHSFRVAKWSLRFNCLCETHLYIGRAVVLVTFGCWKKVAQTGWLETTEMAPFTEPDPSQHSRSAGWHLLCAEGKWLHVSLLVSGSSNLWSSLAWRQIIPYSGTSVGSLWCLSFYVSPPFSIRTLVVV